MEKGKIILLSPFKKNKGIIELQSGDYYFFDFTLFPENQREMIKSGQYVTIEKDEKDDIDTIKIIRNL